ncbi:hypothetical protein A0128_05205 [Leptospira tipperaryensis]|uniref:SnoaL-like domain-containing protein n=1 Tax=Leptospira tipperaryensis TaxID=2564040 RepID=A0A1D7UUL1_9LEPT|nr:hypothetical protein [Leptospira tipperaryensis]AOP33296.1 hypothetical protein A0128_05205 [Leptospira tipperaryensis]
MDRQIHKEISKADKTINEKDYETLTSCYTHDAILMIKLETLAKGRDEVIEAYKKIADYFKDSLKVTQGKMLIYETDLLNFKSVKKD